MQSIIAELKSENVAVIGVCSDSSEITGEKMASKKITFPLLADPELQFINACGLQHENGNPFGGDIARPALILVRKDGAILFRMLTDNWRVRPTPEIILEKVRSSL